MRTNKAFKNVLFSILYYGSLMVLSLILRRVFLQYLNVELLGVEGVVGNLFSLMALVDVGTGSLITYLLYKAFSENNKGEVSILMGMYRNMYLIIAAIMSILSIFLVPILPFIISSTSIEWSMVLLIYFIKCLGMVGSYCYSYRRLLFKVSQNEYVCTKIDMAFTYVRYMIWFAVLYFWQSYIIYLIVEVLLIFLANIYISILSYKRFPYATGKGVKWSDYKERHFFKDMKNTYIIKISGTIYGATDNLVISFFMGLKSVALLSNYLLITSIILNGFNKLVVPLEGSIGNFVYTESQEDSIRLFKKLDMFAFLLGTTLVGCFITSVNDFVKLWIGSQYQFNLWTVIVIGLTLYIGIVSQFTSCFRNVYGKFELDRTYAFIGAVLNIVLSIVLVKYLGVAGVYVGTIFGMIGFWVGRYRVLNNELFKGMVAYISIQLKYFIVFAAIVAISLILCQFVNVGPMTFVIKALISIFIAVVINYIVFHKSDEYKGVLDYLKRSKSFVSIGKKKLS